MEGHDALGFQQKTAASLNGGEEGPRSGSQLAYREIGQLAGRGGGGQ